MEYRRLGRSGLRVSSLCLGGMTFGEADENSFMHGASSDEHTAMAILNRALELGINFIDTADVYGQEGLSERVIGKWLSRDGRRDDIVLATKFRFRMREGINGTGASRYRIVQAAEQSLRRLKTDRIDLYQIHMQDRQVEEDEILRALDDLVRQGKVLYIGCSNYAAYRLVHSLWLSDRHNLERFVALQTQYSLIVRDIEREHTRACAQFGLGILPWSPLASGFLTGKYQQGQPAPRGSRMSSDRFAEFYKRFDRPRNWAIVDALVEIAQALGAPPSQVALAWLLTRPAVSSVIFGARTLGQLEDNAAAAELSLPPPALEQLDEASRFEAGYPYDFIAGIDGDW